MPKWTRFALGWALAALLAVALSWGAVAQVRNRVIQPSTPIPTTGLAAADVGANTNPDPTVIRLEPEVDGSIEVTGPASATDQTTSTLAPAPPSTDGSASSSSGDSGTTSTTNATTTTAAPATSSTSSTTTTTAAPATTATTTTTAAPVTAQTSSYQLLGGVVTISYSPDVVNFVSAFPQSGYSTDIREYGPEEVRVRFESGDHTSDFRARWENGELQITKNETGDD